MKILVTGGAGYIGTSLIPLLLQKKYQVTVLDNLMYGGIALLPYFRNKNFSFIKEDVRNEKALQSICKDKDIVIHLAAIVGFPACRQDPILAHEVNYLGSKNLVKSLSKDQLLIFSSTGSNYGALTDEICTEETPLKPLSIYGKTKTAAEKFILYNSNCIVYRFATGFGVSPRMRLDLLVNEFVYQAVKQRYLVVYEKNFMRTFIHVYDMAQAFLFAFENIKKMKNQVYNVGSESMNFSKLKICEIIRKYTDAYIHYADVGEDADKRNYLVSYEKIRKIGFKTKITISKGIEELVKTMSVLEIQTPFFNT